MAVMPLSCGGFRCILRSGNIVEVPLVMLPSPAAIFAASGRKVAVADRGRDAAPAMAPAVDAAPAPVPAKPARNQHAPVTAEWIAKAECALADNAAGVSFETACRVHGLKHDRVRTWLIKTGRDYVRKVAITATPNRRTAARKAAR